MQLNGPQNLHLLSWCIYPFLFCLCDLCFPLEANAPRTSRSSSVSVTTKQLCTGMWCGKELYCEPYENRAIESYVHWQSSARCSYLYCKRIAVFRNLRQQSVPPHEKGVSKKLDRTVIRILLSFQAFIVIGLSEYFEFVT